jgi:hypothetical protein
MKTNEALKYTLTVLPAPLIPHSRIPVDVIFNTYSDYINGKITTQYAAALYIFCASRHSFRLYYVRIIANQNTWHMFFSKLQGNCIEAAFESLEAGWTSIVIIMREFAYPLHSSWWKSYAHAVLCHNGMGLGP